MAGNENGVEPNDANKGHGITDDDMVQIAAFLEKPRYERSVDDLRP